MPERCLFQTLEEAEMTKGKGEKLSAKKRTFNSANHPDLKGPLEPYEQEPKRRIGQHTGSGVPPLTKK